MPYHSSNRVGNRLSSHVNRRIPRNSAALSRSIEIVVAGLVVGYVQSLNASEGRTIEDIREIGNEDIVELAPGGPTGLTLTLSRVMLYHSRLHQVMDEFGDHGNYMTGIRSLMDFNVPFDVVVMMRRNTVDDVTKGSFDDALITAPGNLTETRERAGSDQELVIMDHFHECYPEKNDYKVDATDKFTITENLNCKYTWRTGSPLFVAGNSNINLGSTSLPTF